MNVTMVLYHNNFPPRKLTLVRCIVCTRPLLKTNAGEMILSNMFGFSDQSVPLGSAYIEHKCHSCGATYRILFQ